MELYTVYKWNNSTKDWNTVVQDNLSLKDAENICASESNRIGFGRGFIPPLTRLYVYEKQAFSKGCHNCQNKLVFDRFVNGKRVVHHYQCSLSHEIINQAVNDKKMDDSCNPVSGIWWKQEEKRECRQCGCTLDELEDAFCGSCEWNMASGL